MTFGNALKLIGILSDNGIAELDIMGGEPLLLDWMPDFVGAVLGKGLAVNLSTNGSRPDAISKLRRFRGEKLSIGISLEGSTEQTHAAQTGSLYFTEVRRGIETLSAPGFEPVVKTVVTRETMDDIQAIADLLKEKGVRRYYLLHMDLLSDDHALQAAALAYPEFLSFYERIRDANPDISILKVNASCFERNTLPPGVRCAAGVRKLAIMPDGSVYPCNLLHRMPSFRLANIFETDMTAIWNTPALDAFRRDDGNSCQAADCANRPSCTGGCPAHAYFHAGKPSSGDVRCLLQRQLPV